MGLPALLYQGVVEGRSLQDNLAGPASDHGGLQSDNLWFLGVFMELLGTLASVAGKQMFRHAAVTGERKFYAYGGICVVLIYPALDILALEFAAQTVVSTVTGMVVVWNILLAPCTLGEDMTTKRISSAVVIMLGIVGAGSFGPHYEIVRTPDQELTQMFKTGGAIAYYLLLFSWLALGYGVLLRNETLMPKQSLRNGALQGAPPPSPAPFPQHSGCPHACSLHRSPRTRLRGASPVLTRRAVATQARSPVRSTATPSW